MEEETASVRNLGLRRRHEELREQSSQGRSLRVVKNEELYDIVVQVSAEMDKRWG
jgi:hypothetical protein